MALTWAAWITCALAVAGVFALGINMTLRPTPHPGPIATRVAAATAVLVVVASCLSLAAGLS